jgi:seryl-tRNA synthetase
VAQRWIRWHTTQTPGFNPLQRALDQSHHLSRSLQEQERIAAASGSDQTKHLLTKVTNYESNIHSLKKEVDQLKRTTQDLNTRIRDLGDSVPLHVTPSNRASLWRTWVTSSVLFLPVLNNIQQSIGSIVCLFHGDEQ